ncbi:MAG TPA: lytic transglycosylase domain-containing protein [Noviherbaspirillum sp.]|jgi:soluble lytic murein transglycosylase-like protein|uniref:lytic transglycosylase domain-containing protein n=1 Tax=Noviherbaspirillum sp. TaxID=1926288 RepID=UPI002DDD3334|nr:lytic transglycosylase domain-containing protein [Noviherbaspirillum sp.]HEV2612476.1 lytic transglycosylase domain-containing protein [Noviherbaspirillum sp.]
MRLPGLLLVYCLGLSALPAHADIYGYIDGEGIAHFSTEKLDNRYQLFMQGGDFDSSRIGAQPETGTAQVSTPLTNYLVQHPNLKKFEPLLLQAAQEFSLDPALLKAVMAAESAFNPAAVSPKGAVGLMQIMPATAERYGLQGDKKKTVEQKLTDPKTNIRLGARYLRDLHRMFPDQPDLVVASYNAGEGAVQKYKNSIPPYPETRNYVRLVTQFYRLYQPAAAKLAVTTFSGTAAKRIHMTIPGRRNMPTAMLD